MRAYPADPYWALRAANFRDAAMPGVMCKTCAHFLGLEGRCGRFGADASQSMVCDEWE